MSRCRWHMSVWEPGRAAPPTGVFGATPRPSPPDTRELPMPGLVPGTHIFVAVRGRLKTWMAWTSPATGSLCGTLPLASIVVLAKAGTHLSEARATERWVPAFAGMTILAVARLAVSGG